MLLSEIPNAEGGGMHIAQEILIGMKPRVREFARRFQRCYFVYILASLRGYLYVGLTDEMRKRMHQHQSGTFDGYTKRYRIDRLMYFETYSDSKVAANREQQIKGYRREKKIALFSSSNPGWKDLTPELFQSIGIPRYGRGHSFPKSRTPRRRDRYSPEGEEVK
jgi:putative endonuclease